MKAYAAMKNENEEVRIGTVHVRPWAGTNSLGSNRVGAYIIVLARAKNPDKYKSLVRREMAGEELDVIEYQDIDSYSQYVAENRISDETRELKDLLTPEEPVQYRTFDCYSSNDS